MRTTGYVVGWSAIAALSVSLAAAGDDARIADAVEQRDTAAVRSLLKKRVDVNAPQPDGATAMHWASYWDDLDVATLLIGAGADANARNELGVTPLSLACTNGSAAMVTRLVTAGADPNLALPMGETALMTCARAGSLDAVKTLLAHGAKPDASEADGRQTALMWAVSEGQDDIAQQLITSGADVAVRSKGGFTPLLFAARAGDLKSARVLTEAGASINDAAPDGSTPLLVASASVVATTASDWNPVMSPSGHEAVALFLVDKGASATIPDQIGTTPLHAAVQTGRLELVKALLAHGANLNARLIKGPPPLRGDYISRDGLAGATPFWLASRAADVSIMRALAAAGADWRIPINNGTTPLMIVAGLGQSATRSPAESSAVESLRLMIELGGDINAVNPAGQTPLHGAAVLGLDTIIRFLADHGAKLDIKDKQGRTPLDVANDGRRLRTSTIELLRKLGGVDSADRQNSLR